MLFPSQVRMKALEEVEMRVRGIALQQKMLPLGIGEIRWTGLPERVQKEATALLSQLILEHARVEMSIEQRERL